MGRKATVTVILMGLLLGVSTGWGQTGTVDKAAQLNQQVIQLSQQGNYAEAVRLGDRTLAIRERVLGPEHLDTARFLDTLGGVYLVMGESGEALSLRQRALAIVEKVRGPEHPETAQSLDTLAEVYSAMGESGKALSLRQRALAIREKVRGPEHPETAQSLDTLAEVYSAIGESGKALPLRQRALAIRETVEEPAQLYRRMNQLYGQRNYAEAVRLGERALAIVEKERGPEHLDTATALDNLARVYFAMWEWGKELPLRQRALAIREKVLGPEHPETATSLDTLASVYLAMGELGKVLPLCQRALAIREKVRGPEHPTTAQSLDNLAWVYWAMGERGKALSLLQRALAIVEKVRGPEDPETASSLGTLAEVYYRMGESGKALPLRQRALAIVEKVRGPEHLDTAWSLDTLASVYSAMGERGKALSLHQRALAIREKVLGPEHPNTAISLTYLAVVYWAMGQIGEALPLLQRALAIREKVLGPKHLDTAQSLDTLAMVYWVMGERGEALPLLQRALAIQEKVLGPEHPGTAHSLDTLAGVYDSMGDPGQALRFFQRSLAAELRTLADVFAVATEEQKFQFMERFSRSYFAALSLIHRHFQRDAPALRFGLEVVLQRKGIVLEAQSRAQNALVANLEGQTLEAWQRLTQQRSTLARLLLRSPEIQHLPDHQRAIAELSSAIAREEEFLAQRSGLLAQELLPRRVTAAMVAEHLPRDGTLVEFVRIPDRDSAKEGGADSSRYLAFVLAPDSQVTLVDLGAAQQIDTTINRTLRMINTPADRQNLQTHAHQVDAALSQLYGLLLQPLEAALGGRPRLILSPDAELNKVPFAALRAPDGRYLVETLTLSYVASGRDLLRGKTGVSPTVDLLLVANPAFDDQAALHVAAVSSEAVQVADFRARFPPLPGTAEEARTIPPLVTGTRKMVLTGRQATEAAVRAVQAPRILHLATHGFFLQDEELALPDTLTSMSWLDSGSARGLGGVRKLSALSSRDRRTTTRVRSMVRSGLALAGANHASTVTTGDDGLLTALEVSGMNLYGTALVVLSACQTAVGDVRIGEGVYGLRRAFVLAGAKNLVMSLWPVNDQVTLTQMERFYQAYGQGASPAEALRRAQLQTIAELRARTRQVFGVALAPVRLWAPFIVQQTGE